ncbi:MAG: LysR, substrate-binding protein, partial [Nocardioides sp.]|nr:LysR, substrate-binding protein [Nocardioides sp.]
MQESFRVGFVTGATPDKWARVWRERHPRQPLDLVPVTQAEQEEGLRGGDLSMCLVRLPVDREGLHCIPLYDEVPVAVVGAEHVATVMDELT